MTLYADDPDVHETYPIKDAAGGTLAFSPVVRVAGHPDITAAWDGEVRTLPIPPGESVAPTQRDLRVPLFGLPAGTLHRLRLVIHGDNDVALGFVRLV